MFYDPNNTFCYSFKTDFLNNFFFILNTQHNLNIYNMSWVLDLWTHNILAAQQPIMQEFTVPNTEASKKQKSNEIPSRKQLKTSRSSFYDHIILPFLQYL